MIEIRKCIKCDSLFEFNKDKGKKSTYICDECRKEYQRNYENKKSRVALEGYKEPYPYPESEKIARFRNIQDTLKKMHHRSEWQEFFKQQIKNLEENETAILKWIYDRRNQEAVLENSLPRANKKDEYSDTRSTHQNKSWFD